MTDAIVIGGGLAGLAAAAGKLGAVLTALVVPVLLEARKARR